MANPVTVVRAVVAGARGLYDLWQMWRGVRESEPEPERTNVVKIREQAAGAANTSESRNAGRRR